MTETYTFETAVGAEIISEGAAWWFFVLTPPYAAVPLSGEPETGTENLPER